MRSETEYEIVAEVAWQLEKYYAGGSRENFRWTVISMARKLIEINDSIYYTSSIENFVCNHLKGHHYENIHHA